MEDSCSTGTPNGLDPQQVVLNPAERMKILVQSATISKMNNEVPLSRYYRSLMEMYKVATVYKQEKNYEKAFTLYLRFTSMLLEALPTHKDASTFESEERREVESLMQSAMAEAEICKKLLRNLYDQSAQNMKEQMARLALLQSQQNRAQVSCADEQPSTASTCLGPTSKELAINFAEGTKTMAIPGDLIRTFLKLAEENTTRNIETCGILCGKLVRGRFIVSHVILPQQTGQSDGCVATGEDEVFRLQDRFELDTAGWIHSHPTQTAFLSSVDLHTHCAYQLMMPEAVAIVCSPKHNEVGVFTMTTHGLQVVSSCALTGFHPHPETHTPLYEKAKHVTFPSSLNVKVIDLRTQNPSETLH